MWNDQPKRALGLLRGSAPFVVLRVALAAGIALAYVLLTGAGAALGTMLAARGGSEALAGAPFWGAAAGFGLVSAALYGLRAQLLYRVKAGHIAVLVRLIDGQPVPAGRAQLAFAATAVRARFAGSALLSALDQRIKGVLRACGRAVPAPSGQEAGPERSAPGRRPDRRAWMPVARLAPVVLGHVLHSGRGNPWAGARDALVLCAQNHAGLAGPALRLGVQAWLLTAAVFAAVLPTAAVLAGAVPGLAGFWSVALAAVVAGSVKAALIEPLALACLMRAWAAAVRGDQPRQEWAARLNAVSGGFRVLGEQALGWVGGAPADPGQRLPARPAVS